MTKLVDKTEGDGCYILDLWGPNSVNCRYFSEEEPRKPFCNRFNVSLGWNESGRVLKCVACLRGGMPMKMQARRRFMLNEVGPKKIAVIKVVRETTDLGLKEAYDLVTIVQSMSDPQEVPIRKSMEHKDALALFRAIGATVESEVIQEEVKE